MAQAQSLVEAWMPFLREAGGGSADLANELRVAASNASYENLVLARTMQTFPGVMAALQGDPDGDRAVIERAARATEHGDPAVAAQKAFGDVDRDLLYVPVPPCRIVDTRVAGGLIQAGTTRGFDVTAVSNYSFQGGSSSDCGGAGSAGSFGAAVLTLTVPGAASSGSLTAFAFAATQPATTSLEYSIGQSVSNTLTVQLDQGPAANELSIFSTANAHVVIDIVGYFRNGGTPQLLCQETAQTIDSVNAGATQNTTAPACPAGFTQTSTNCQSSTWQMPFVYFTNGICSAQNNSSGTASLRASRTCCRVNIP